ncbi:MAG: DUF6029 family protein [Chitinophagales bacterium]
MKLKYSIILFLVSFAVCSNSISAQNEGVLSGDLQLNTRFFESDSVRDATNTPFYDYLKYGADAWFNLNYQVGDFNMGLRFDVFNNSNIFNPTREVNELGLGFWYINKKIDKLDLTAGYFYEQFGSGIVFRAYEARPLGIDQSIQGIRLKYALNDKWRITGFTGRQRNLFETYKPVIKGAKIEGYIKASDKIKLSPGLGVINRTIDTETMNNIAQEINGYALENRFVPKYNVYAGTFYNTLYAGKFSWYTEYAYKTEDSVRDMDGLLINPKSGNVIYNTLTYSQKGFGITVQYKHTENFDLRVHPNAIGNFGTINFLPPMTRANSYRLMSRYNAATQLLGENALQMNLTYTPKKGLTFTGNYSNITNLDNDLLFREFYLDAEIKPKDRKKKWRIISGLQLVDYNQTAFEGPKPDRPDFVRTFSPFFEYNYKFTRRKSMRFELQYMLTERNRVLFGDDTPEKKQDLGDWVWALAEYNIVPKWSFSAGSMYNIHDKLFFPTFLIARTQKATRFALNYAKQPAGIICTGGICRFEPAFSGLKLDVTTKF